MLNVHFNFLCANDIWIVAPMWLNVILNLSRLTLLDSAVDLTSSCPRNKTSNCRVLCGLILYTWDTYSSSSIIHSIKFNVKAHFHWTIDEQNELKRTKLWWAAKPSISFLLNSRWFIYSIYVEFFEINVWNSTLYVKLCVFRVLHFSQSKTNCIEILDVTKSITVTQIHMWRCFQTKT